MSEGITIGVDTGGLDKLKDRFAVARKKAPAAAMASAHDMGIKAQTQVRQHASGRPGPNVITDAYRESIHMTGVESKGTSATATVSTGEPQAHRLENGFVGTDARGRHYHQPPFPHWKPALNDLLGMKGVFGKQLADRSMP